MKILVSPGVGEYEEKKSRFIAHLASVSTEEEAVAFFDEIKKKYWDAKHNCTAFVIGEDASLTRCSDDGEPSGTAGKPILNVLLHSEIRNIACVVTRYFGGTLLGTGGLIKAYSDAVSAAVSNSVVAEEIKGIRIPFVIEYENYSKVQSELERNGVSLKDAAFTDKVSAAVEIPAEMEEEVKGILTRITCGKVKIEEYSDCIIRKMTE
ncbi:MAG: YigZ family protein [Lachnospiraceae bacterium]|nr:YigZ family protein [Lachnospiraceae bacterium]